MAEAAAKSDTKFFKKRAPTLYAIIAFKLTKGILFLALASYSPLDPSWNSASVLTGSHAARNWIGVVGAYTADALLQFFGVGAFLLAIFPTMLGLRWFRSIKVQSPVAKSLGGIWLMMFVPALLALLPGHLQPGMQAFGNQ